MDALILFLVVIGALFYLLPSAIASIRQAEHLGAIIIINVLLGWTVLGWLAALVWAVSEKPHRPESAKA
jgi:hypothetical protein